MDLLLQDCASYICVFVSILRDINKEATVEYVLALIDEMLIGTDELWSYQVPYIVCLCLWQQILKEPNCLMMRSSPVRISTSFF